MKNTTIADIWFQGKVEEGCVGIEVEVEAENPLPNVNNTWWETKTDPSLRGNSAEYVNKKPMPVDDRMLARITKMTELVDTPLVKVDKNSHRTSVHVHCNVLGYTPTQTYTAITGYWLLEDMLFKWLGADREGHLFCLRLKDADGIIKHVQNDLLGRQELPFSHFTNDMTKYGALNLGAVQRFGSLELRGMGACINPNKIDVWSATAYKLFENAVLNFDSPEALLDFFYHNGPRKLISILIPDNEIRARCLNVHNMDALADENACKMTHFAYSTNWGNYQKNINKTFENKIKMGKPLKKKPQQPDNWRFVEEEIINGVDEAQEGVNWRRVMHGQEPWPIAVPPLPKKANPLNRNRNPFG